MSQAKSKKIVSHPARQARIAIGKNILRRLAELYPGKSRTYTFERIEDQTGIKLSSMQRITQGKVGASIDTLANIAHALGSPLADLMRDSMDGLTDSRPTEPGQRLQRRPRA